MENNENKKNQTESCKNNNDLRTFVIAALTAIAVVAVYHFAMGAISIFNGTYEKDYLPPVCNNYVLVPVSALPQFGPCGMKPEHKRNHHGMCQGKRHDFKRGMRGPQPGMMCPMKERACKEMCPDKPGKPCPMMKAPAPAKPAPAK